MPCGRACRARRRAARPRVLPWACARNLAENRESDAPGVMICELHTITRPRSRRFLPRAVVLKPALDRVRYHVRPVARARLLAAPRCGRLAPPLQHRHPGEEAAVRVYPTSARWRNTLLAPPTPSQIGVRSSRSGDCPLSTSCASTAGDPSARSTGIDRAAPRALAREYERRRPARAARDRFGRRMHRGRRSRISPPECACSQPCPLRRRPVGIPMAACALPSSRAIHRAVHAMLMCRHRAHARRAGLRPRRARGDAAHAPARAGDRAHEPARRG